MSETRALIRCDEAKVPEKFQRQSWSLQRSLTSLGSTPELNLHAQSLAGTVLEQINPHAADLVRIASYVYAADQIVSRGGEADVYGRKWRRHFGMCIPVNRPAFWMNDKVRQRLVNTLSFLTEDSWEFSFSQAPDAMKQIPLDLRDRELLGRPNTVILFSGGADSLCATVDAVTKRDRHPVLVSHRPVPTTSSRQTGLAALLRERFADWTFPHLSFWIHRRGSDAADTSQRSRSFLFACLGAAIAVELGTTEVLLSDNGVVSINLPTSGQLIGSRASRSTHPRFLYELNRFLDEVFETPVAVRNSLEARTRAEALEILKTASCADLLQETVSCSHTRGRTTAKPQCGYCSQCVDRRFGVLAAGLEEHDLPERYEVDVFTDTLHEGEPRTIAESYVRFARRIQQTDREVLFDEFPQLFDCLLPGQPAPDRTAEMLTKLLKRHAGSVEDGLKAMIARHSRELAASTLPPDCLLCLAVGTPPTTARPHEQVVDNVFLHDGNIWTLTYRGITRHLKHSKGLSYIARLLGHPGMEFHALDLQQERPSQDGPLEPHRLLEVMRGDSDFAKLGLDGAKPDEPLLDTQARAEYRERLASLKHERGQINASESGARAAELDYEIQYLEQELKSATGLGGRARGFPTNAERARKAVSDNVKRALRNIGDAHAQLHEHLRTSIRTGSYCVYQHDSPPDWKL